MTLDELKLLKRYLTLDYSYNELYKEGVSAVDYYKCIELLDREINLKSMDPRFNAIEQDVNGTIVEEK